MSDKVEIINPYARGGVESYGTPVVPGGGEVVQVGGAADRAVGDFITAQRVAVKRDLGGVLRDVDQLAVAMGRDAYYSIPYKDRAKQTTTHVEGPTIQLAYAVMSVYGNCRSAVRLASETPTHWHFEGLFTDLEKGVTVSRPFQQRKGQNTGMKDNSRAQDAIFGIGASKAARNAIVAGLGWIMDRAVDKAKEGIVDRISNNPDAAREWLTRQFADIGVPIEWVARVVGRPVARWTAPDMAKLFAQMQAVRDSMVLPEDLWPDPARIDPETGEVREPGAIEGKPAAQPAPQPEAKPAERKATRKPAAEAREAAPASPEAQEPAEPTKAASEPPSEPEKASAPEPAPAAQADDPGPSPEPAGDGEPADIPGLQFD